MVTKLNFYLIGLLLTSSIITGAFWYYSVQENEKLKLRNEIAQLQTDVATYKNAVELQKAAILFKEQEQKRIREQFEATQEAFKIIQQDNKNLKDRLTVTQLENQTTESPAVAEAIINKNSENMNRCFELLSGAPLNDSEKSAKTPEEFNFNCPWLFNRP